MSGIVDSVVELGPELRILLLSAPRKSRLKSENSATELEADLPQFLAIQPTTSAEPACCSQNVLAEVGGRERFVAGRLVHLADA
jgi:hypothetical protein